MYIILLCGLDLLICCLGAQGLDGVGNKADGSQRVVVKLDGLNFSSGEGQERLVLPCSLPSSVPTCFVCAAFGQ